MERKHILGLFSFPKQRAMRHVEKELFFLPKPKLLLPLFIYLLRLLREIGEKPGGR
jgi:hypothetical protein